MLLISAMYSAQIGGQTPTAEVSSRETPITFTSKVNLVLVPVVARDKDGRAIGTLHQEDFQVFDKGKPQIITRFEVEKPAAPSMPAAVAKAVDENGVEKEPGKSGPASAATPLASQFVAYVFDDVHFKASDLIPARLAADRHLAEFLGPATRAAVYTTSGQVMLDFTDDRDKLHQALLRVQPLNNMQDASGCSVLNGYWADAIVNQNDTQALTAAVDEYMACDAGGSALNLQATQSLIRSQAISQLAHDESVGLVTLKTLEDVVRRISATPGSHSMILASPGFFMDSRLRPGETELIDRAIRGRVALNSLDARGVYTVLPGGDASQGARKSTSASNYMMLLEINMKNRDADVMGELADATGGRFFHNDNGMLQGFAQLSAEPEYVYVLGFSAQNLKLDGSYHSLKVTLRNPKGLDMQARRGYYAPDRAIDPEEQAKQEIEEAVFSQEELIDLPVDLSLQFLKSSDASAKLNVLAKVDLKRLRFRKADDRNNNTLTVVSTVFDRNGNYVAGIKKVVDMRVKDETLDNLKSGVTVKTTLDVVPGKYMVRLVVRDSEDQVMSARSGFVEIR